MDISAKIKRILKEIQRFYLRIGIDKLIEIRIMKTIFFYLSFFSFSFFTFAMCLKFISGMNLNCWIPFILLIFSLICGILFVALEDQEYNDNFKKKNNNK